MADVSRVSGDGRAGATAPTTTADAARAFRHAACDAMRLPRQTGFVVCYAHGNRGRVEDVYGDNNWIRDEDGLRCEPSHPFCFRTFGTRLGGAHE